MQKILFKRVQMWICQDFHSQKTSCSLILVSNHLPKQPVSLHTLAGSLQEVWLYNIYIDLTSLDVLRLMPVPNVVTKTRNDLQWSTMTYNDLQWSTMTYNDLQWPTMTYNDLQWSTMTYNDLQWSTMTHNDLQWPTMIYNELLRAARS